MVQVLFTSVDPIENVKKCSALTIRTPEWRLRPLFLGCFMRSLWLFFQEGCICLINFGICLLYFQFLLCLVRKNYVIYVFLAIQKKIIFRNTLFFIKALWYCNFSVSQFSNTCGGVSVSQNIQLISFIFFKEMVIFAGRYSLYYQLILSRNGTVRIWLLFRVNLLIYGEFPYQLNIALKSREVFMGSYQTMNP